METAGETPQVDFDFLAQNPRRLYRGWHKGVLKELYVVDVQRESRSVTFGSSSPSFGEGIALEAVSELMVLPKDSTDFVYEHSDRYIRATVGEAEGVFYAAEHVNFGRGWLMCERDLKIMGVVSSGRLVNPVALEAVDAFSNGSAMTFSQPLAAPPTARTYSLENPVEYRIPAATQAPLHPHLDTPDAASRG